MFLLTNRAVRADAAGSAELGDVPSAHGPNELRIVQAEREGRAWSRRLLPNAADERMQRCIRAAMPNLADDFPLRASHYAALRTLCEAHRTGRNVLVFVHGYNCTVESVLDCAERLSRTYDVIVLPFTWPANGGGDRLIDDACGVLSYRSDKRDARASASALDRAICIMHERLRWLDEHLPFQSSCRLTINLLLHSMGAYLYKCVLSTTAHSSTALSLFDNVILCAADANSPGHREWVDRIAVRNRVYITINEDDYALRLSRLKLGDAQLARLGHWPHALHAAVARYVNFTDAAHVGDAHCYFEGDPIRNESVRRFFADAFNGKRAEDVLGRRYDPLTNAFRIE